MGLERGGLLAAKDGVSQMKEDLLAQPGIALGTLDSGASGVKIKRGDAGNSRLAGKQGMGPQEHERVAAAVGDVQDRAFCFEVRLLHHLQS